MSATGAVIHATADDASGPLTLSWSTAAPVVAVQAASLRTPALSPDTTRIAGVGADPAASDIWVADLARGAGVRLTHGGTNVAPIWASDREVIYASGRNGPFELWRRDSSAAAPARLILSSAALGRHLFPTSTSRDGTLIAFVESGGPTRADIWTIRTSGASAAPVVQTSFDEINGMLSPDGRLIAYQSDESGRWEISLMRLSDARRVGVSAGGGVSPLWASDGRTLFYRAGPSLVRVEVDASGERVGPPVAVGDLTSARLVGLGPDGRLLRQSEPAPASSSAILTLEWIQEIRRTLGPPASPLPR